MTVSRIIFIFLLLSKITYSQNIYPLNVFQSPMTPPLELAGTFAELRQVNFHTGIDIRVAGRNDKSVFSIGNGYISRIKIEPSGYGKAIYITHPEGYVSVYAHLEQFGNEVNLLVKSLQYRLQSFSLDVNFPEDSIRVSKGQKIGIAGNTGYSFGPHLHFEIRDALTEEIIDPLLFGLIVTDNLAPDIEEMKIYIHGQSTVDEINQDMTYKTRLQSSGRYSITQIPVVSGAVSFGFKINDRQNKHNPNNLGLRKLTIYVDDSLFFEVLFDKLSFSIARHQLAYIDISEKNLNNKYFHTSWKKPGNRLPIYQFVRNDGILFIQQERDYSVQCIAEDATGNKSQLLFTIEGKNNTYDNGINCKEHELMFHWDTVNTWNSEYSKIVFPAGSLFSDECFDISEYTTETNDIAPILSIMNKNAPADFYQIALKPYQAQDHSDKVIIAQVTEKGSMNGIKTSFTGEFYEAETRAFGKYTLVKDTISPVITAKNIPLKGNVEKLKIIRFNVTDNISGIKSYDAYINNQWVLLEYDLKSDEMFYLFDKKTPVEQFEFRVVVTDACGNTSVWKKNLSRTQN